MKSAEKKTYKNVDVGWDGDQNFYKQGWFGGMDGTKYCFSKNRTENSDVIKPSEIPETSRGQIWSSGSYYMPVYSLSQESAFLSKECMGCLVINWDSDGDKVKTNLWNLVWNRLSGYEYDGGTFYEGTDMEIDYPASKPKGLVDKLTQNTAGTKEGDKEIQLPPKLLKDGNDYTLSNNFLREELLSYLV